MSPVVSTQLSVAADINALESCPSSRSASTPEPLQSFASTVGTISLSLAMAASILASDTVPDVISPPE